jgi:hypothetical protein
MSLWNRITAKLRSGSGAPDVTIVGDRLVFHTRARAATLPNEPGQWASRDNGVWPEGDARLFSLDGGRGLQVRLKSVPTSKMTLVTLRLGSSSGRT